MNILHLIASPRGKASQSTTLGNEIAAQLQAKYPGSTLKTHDLTETLFPHLEEVHLNSFFTPAADRTSELLDAVRYSDEAIRELFDADAIVISTPTYNFGVPSALKAWIDHIARAGITFSYSAAGAEGLVKNKKAYLAIASGAVFSEGEWKRFDFVEPYLKLLLGFIGITEVTTFRVEGLNIPDLKDTAVPKAIGSVEAFAF